MTEMTPGPARPIWATWHRHSQGKLGVEGVVTGVLLPLLTGGNPLTFGPEE